MKIQDKCDPQPFSSAACAMGTKGCEVQHPPRMIYWADGRKTPLPLNLIGDFEGIKSHLGFEMGEIVYLPRGFVMILDEEGKLKHRPTPNLLATAIANIPGDVIVGNVVICPWSDIS